MSYKRAWLHARQHQPSLHRTRGKGRAGRFWRWRRKAAMAVDDMAALARQAPPDAGPKI
jgi:hypothetical protein